MSKVSSEYKVFWDEADSR